MQKYEASPGRFSAAELTKQLAEGPIMDALAVTITTNKLLGIQNDWRDGKRSLRAERVMNMGTMVPILCGLFQEIFQW